MVGSNSRNSSSKLPGDSNVQTERKPAALETLWLGFTFYRPETQPEEILWFAQRHTAAQWHISGFIPVYFSAIVSSLLLLKALWFRMKWETKIVWHGGDREAYNINGLISFNKEDNEILVTFLTQKNVLNKKRKTELWKKKILSKSIEILSWKENFQIFFYTGDMSMHIYVICMYMSYVHLYVRFI